MRIVPLSPGRRMRPNRGLVLRVLLAVPALPSDRHHALLETDEAAIHAATASLAQAKVRTPGIILRFGWSTEHGCGGGNANYE